MFEICLEQVSAEAIRDALNDGRESDALSDEVMLRAKTNLARLLHDMGYAVMQRTLDAVAKRTAFALRSFVAHTI